MCGNESLSQSILKVVVLNDDVTQLKIISGLLQKAGVEPVPFTDAGEALSSLSHEMAPALIVTDLYMPGIDGWRFCRLLRSPEFQKFNQVPILVVSATFSGEEASRITSELGANAFLPMPFDGEEFIDRVNTLLRGENLQVCPTVLAVGDSVLFLGELARAFQAHGYQIDTAGTCLEARTKMQQNNFDIAVLDHHLPDGEGVDLLVEMHEKLPDCICVMMTADNRSDLALKWLRAGAAAYLRKPFEPEYLIAECERARRERALLRIQDLLEIRTRKLGQSEERFRSLVESSEDLIFSVDRQGVFLTAGGNRLKDFGLRPEDVVQKTLFDLFPEPEARRYQTKHLEVFESNKPISYEQAFEYAGVTKTDLTTLYPIRSESGKVDAVGVICRDITEEKKNKMALLESQRLYHDLIEKQTDLVCRWLPDTTLTYVNEAYCAYFNRTRDELSGLRFISMMPEKTGRTIQKVIESLSGGEFSSLRSDEMNNGPQGAVRWVQWVYSAIKDENGKVVEFQSVGRDITEQKLGEQLLKLQHSLSTQLNSARDISEAICLILATCLQFDSIDSGGAYVVDPDNGCLKLIEHSGLSADFIATSSTYFPDSPEFLLARKGQIIFGSYEEIRYRSDREHRIEGLQALAVLPFLVGGELVAMLNLASHTQTDFPEQVKFTLEIMVQQLSSVLESIQAKMAVQNSMDELKLIVTAQQDLMIKTDAKGQILLVNPAFCAMFGKTEEELLGTGYTPLIHPDDMSVEEKAAAQVLVPPFIYTYEVRVQTVAGWRWLSWAARSICDDHGNVVFLIKSGRDITERKQAEEERNNENTRRRILMEQSKDGIVILDCEGKVYESNRKFADMLGYSFESMNQLSVFDWDIHIPQEHLKDMLYRLDETGDHFTTKHRRKDGSIIDVEISTNAAWFDGQKLIFCVCRDITDQKRLEQELSLKSLVLDQIQDHVTITDLEGTITYVNEAEIKTVGLPFDHLVGNNTNIYGENAEKGATQRQILENTLRDGFWRCEVVNYAGDGSEHFMDCRTQIIQDTEGKPIALCGIATDITMRKYVEEKLSKSEKKFRSYFDLPVVGMAVISPENEWIEVNAKFCDLLGYTLEDLCALSWDDLTLLEDQEEDKVLYNSFLNGETDSCLREKRFVRKDRSILHAIVSTNCVRNIDGSINYFMTVIQDNTERKHAEKRIHEQLEELKRWYSIALAREDRIMELKREINYLLAEAGKPPRFASATSSGIDNFIQDE